MSDPVPEPTIQILARSFASQGRAYGFGTEDYVRFVNALLELALEERPFHALPEGATTLPLAGPGIVVRATRSDDRQRVAGWVEEPRGRHFLLSRSTGRVLTVDGLFDDPDHVLGMVCVPDQEEPVGIVAFLRRAADPNKAELRKLVGDPAMRGRGIGTAASRHWVGFGIHALGLKKIFLYTLATNGANLRVNEQIGFRIEGVLQAEVSIDGERVDLVRMALTR
jgi:RimJ/RimL family protein N-acetyltransferase